MASLSAKKKTTRYVGPDVAPGGVFWSNAYDLGRALSGQSLSYKERRLSTIPEDYCGQTPAYLRRTASGLT